MQDKTHNILNEKIVVAISYAFYFIDKKENVITGKQNINQEKNPTEIILDDIYKIKKLDMNAKNIQMIKVVLNKFFIISKILKCNYIKIRKKYQQIIKIHTIPFIYYFEDFVKNK